MILGAIGAAVLGLNVQIQSVANSSKFKTISESQAQSMIERARNVKVSEGGVSSLTDGCYTSEDLITPSFTAAQCTCSSAGIVHGGSLPNLGPNFKGYLVVSPSSGGGKRIQSVVGYVEKNKTVCTEVDTYMYDY